MKIDNIKLLAGTGMNLEDAPEYVKDYIVAYNFRVGGTDLSEQGDGTNPESTALITQSVPAGINKGIGGGSFEDVGLVVFPRFNTAGNCQIVVYNNLTQTEQVVYEDVTDSAGLTLLPWNPQNYIKFILVNETYLIWVGTDLEVGYTNLNTLISGGYGTVLAEDLSLLKPQCLIPPTGTYGSDLGQAANYWYGQLPMFTVQWVNEEFNYSFWSTRSKRIVPYQQNTPTLGQNVTQNNYIILAVNAGSIRVQTINIARQRNAETVFSIIRSVNRDYVITLPHTAVDVATEIYEAYDPATNLYYYVSYGNELAIPVAPTQTDATYSYVWPSNTVSLINGNIVALSDLNVGYPRPTTSVTVKAIGYNPNIQIPAGTYGNPLTKTGSFPGSSGSGAGSHRRIMSVSMGGSPATGDLITIVIADIRNASATQTYTYVVPSAQNGNLAAVVNSISEILPSASYVANGDGTYTITFTGPPYYGLQTYAIQLFFAGANVANSIPTIYDNTTYQLALSYRDGSQTIVGGRFFPLDTDNSFIVTTPSYAQVNGQAIEITWQINDLTAPLGAIDYQWMITAPPVDATIDIIAGLLSYKGSWDAHTNMPTLAVNVGTVGDVYQIGTPSLPTDTTFFNLGSGGPYNTGDYVYYNGQSYSILPKSFGDLTTTGNILAFNINALNLYTSEYSDQGVSTVLSYDFSPGDRCTLHYWIASIGTINTFLITGGTGYTNGTYTGVALTGGTGTGAIATVTVAGNIVTTVVLTTAGSGYSIGDVLTGTVTGGTGWSIGVTALVTMGKNYFNAPCVNLSVLGFDSGNYIVKVENSAAFTYAGGHVLYNGFQIDGRDIFLRLYTPAPINQDISSTLNGIIWREIGERFPITNGEHSVLNGTITDGGAYYLTRQYTDALLSYLNPPIQVLATSFGYSDFYTSSYSSLTSSRPRSYYDELEQTERKAITITSQQYILGSKNNGLTTFYQADIYGEQDGQTSSSFGAIQWLWQRGDILLIGQELNVFYAPVNITYIQLTAQVAQEAISEKLLNNGRYSTSNRGVGKAKEAFCFNEDTGWMVDPNYSDVFEITLAGVFSISGKMNKYLKQVLNSAYSQGYKIVLFYNRYYDELMVCIETLGGVLTLFAFTESSWNPFNNYSIIPADVSATPNGVHCTASYNGTTGVVTYTPTPGYSGNDTATFTFDPGTGPITLNNCLTWIAGDTTTNPYSFAPVVGAVLSTYIQSNSVQNVGPNIAVPISITGGQYSINGGAFTSTAGTVEPNDIVIVEVMSSASYTTLTSCTLTMGGTSATFDVTTRANANFAAQAQHGVNIVAINGSGVPAGFATANVASGNSLYLAYATLAIGDLGITISGTPVMPSKIVLYIAGVDSGHVDITTVPNYIIHNSVTTNDPTLIQVSINLQ